MADNIAITAGAGTTVATDERTIAATSVHVQRVSSEAGTGWATGQVTPTATAATLLAARETRLQCTIINHTNLPMFIGPATVTNANGVLLPAGAAMTFYHTVLLQVICDSVTGLTGKLHYSEAFA